MSEVIDEVGPEHITAVIMESASNNVSANEILEERYGCLFTLHCTAHALDLALESICELPYFSQPVAVSKKVIKVLTNHDSTSALFKSRSKLFLLKPGDTSCHSAYIAVRRLLRCQNAVRSTVARKEWDEWAAKRDYREEAKVYPECLAIETHIENCTLPEDVRLDVFVIFHKRWNNMHSPLHSVAYMLEPQVQGTDFGAADDSEHSILTYQFWAEYGHETPALAAVAKRVTSMVSSARACDRNWSAYDFIHSKMRNKLTAQRANDLVFVSSNLRLMTKFREPEKFAEWVEEIDEEQQEALLGLQDDEEFLPAFEMEDAVDSDHAEESD
ncbi:hypothetical protein WJX79_005329 [Trebouxia sp. C0005]